MAKHHYPKAGEHMAAHAAMIERALNYRISLDVNSAGAYMALVHFAEVWLCYPSSSLIKTWQASLDELPEYTRVYPGNQ